MHWHLQTLTYIHILIHTRICICAFTQTDEKTHTQISHVCSYQSLCLKKKIISPSNYNIYQSLALFCIRIVPKGANLCRYSEEPGIKILKSSHGTVGLPPWVLTHSLFCSAWIPLTIQTRTPFSGEMHTQKCMRSLRGTGFLPQHALYETLILPFCFLENALHESFFSQFMCHPKPKAFAFFRDPVVRQEHTRRTIDSAVSAHFSGCNTPSLPNIPLPKRNASLSLPHH